MGLGLTFADVRHSGRTSSRWMTCRVVVSALMIFMSPLAARAADTAPKPGEASLPGRELGPTSQRSSRPGPARQ